MSDTRTVWDLRIVTLVVGILLAALIIAGAILLTRPSTEPEVPWWVEHPELVPSPGP